MRVILRKDTMSTCIRVYIFITHYLSHMDDVTLTMYGTRSASLP